MSDVRLPRISVVVTCYNCRDYIGDAIRSVARQTLRDFECVIVDDASTDDSVAEVQRTVTELDDPRFRHVRLEKNVGQTGATRRGLAETRATFVCFLDSDDLWNEDFLERHLAAHLNETYAIGFTACNARLIDGQGALIAGCVYWFGHERSQVDRDQAFTPIDPARVPKIDTASGKADWRKQTPYRLYTKRVVHWVWVSTSSMMFRRSLIDLVFPDDDETFRLHMDFYIVVMAQMVAGSLLIAIVAAVVALDGEADLAVLGEFCGVGEQVEDDLPDVDGVADDRGVGAEEDLDDQQVGAAGDRRAHGLDELAQGGAEVEADGVEADLAGLDLGQVEDVADDLHEVATGGLHARGVGDDLGHAALAGLVAHELDVAEDRVQRGAQLVAHVREEGRLGAAGVLGGVDGGLGGDGLEVAAGQLDAALVELDAALLERAVGAAGGAAGQLALQPQLQELPLAAQKDARQKDPERADEQQRGIGGQRLPVARQDAQQHQHLEQHQPAGQGQAAAEDRRLRSAPPQDRYDRHHRPDGGEQHAEGQRQAEQQVERDRRTDHLGEVAGDLEAEREPVLEVEAVDDAVGGPQGAGGGGGLARAGEVGVGEAGVADVEAGDDAGEAVAELLGLAQRLAHPAEDRAPVGRDRRIEREDAILQRRGVQFAQDYLAARLGEQLPEAKPEQRLALRMRGQRARTRIQALQAVL